VRSGQAQATKATDTNSAGTGFLQKFLLAFGGIALFVGIFVIANTLSITVAQRAREFGTLRTIGATRRQVMMSVIIEGFVIGLLASIAGLFLGLGLAKGLEKLFNSLGLELPAASTFFTTRTIVVSLLVGTIVTVLASLFPAIRATRAEPIAAVSEGTLPPSRLARFGPAAAFITPGVALALLLSGALTAAQARSIGCSPSEPASSRASSGWPCSRRGSCRGSRRASAGRRRGSAACRGHSPARTRCAIPRAPRRRRPL
jgi:putative ABC transport system permease protein